MKDGNSSPPWIPIVVGVLGLLAVGISLRHCGTSAAPDSVAGSQLAAKPAASKSEGGGWIAQPRVGGTVSERNRLGSGDGRMASGGSTGTLGGGAEPEHAAPARDLADDTRSAGANDFRDTDTMDVGGDAIAAQPVAPPVDAPGGLGGTSGGAPPGRGPGQAPAAKSSADTAAAPLVVAEPKDAAKTAAEDDTGPVLSMPLDKTTEPDKGDTAPIIVNGVTFDQNGARFSANSQIVVPDAGNANPAAGTITFWILPDWAGDTETDASLVHIGTATFENHATIFKNGRYLRFLFADNTGYESGVGQDVADWKPGDRHMITATWGDGVTALYIDGGSVGEKDYNGELQIGPGTPLQLGSNQAGHGANSNISNFQLYPRALGAEEVATLSAQPPR